MRIVVLFFKNLIACFLTAVVLVSCKTSVFDYHEVPTGSMEPNIEAGGAVFVNKLSYGVRLPLTEKYLFRWSEPAPADIVVLSSPRGEFNNWVKRVVGVGGDRVAVEGDLLYVNGYALECVSLVQSKLGGSACVESFGSTSYPVYWEEKGAQEYPFSELDVPKNHVFVLGDNRNHTLVAGPVKNDTVFGKVYVSVGSERAKYLTVVFNVFVFFTYLFLLLGVKRWIIKSD